MVEDSAQYITEESTKGFAEEVPKFDSRSIKIPPRDDSLYRPTESTLHCLSLCRDRGQMRRFLSCQRAQTYSMVLNLFALSLDEQDARIQNSSSVEEMNASLSWHCWILLWCRELSPCCTECVVNPSFLGVQPEFPTRSVDSVTVWSACCESSAFLIDFLGFRSS
jgi:hypothetical protein